ncbi:hypothetical protein EON77_13235, partial [bacterium]
MPLVACPTCESKYNLKDEFIGRSVACTQCGKPFDALPAAEVAAQPQAHWVYDRDRFFMRQKMLSIDSKYTINDELKQPLIFVVRKTYFLMATLAALAGIVAFLLVAGLLIGGALAISGGEPPRGDTGAIIFAVVAIAALVLGL